MRSASAPPPEFSRAVRRRRKDRLPVPRWQARPAGTSKFGWERIPISFLDVLVVKFLLTFSQSPMRFFGGLGLAGLAAAALVFIYLVTLYLFTQTQQRPVFIAAGVLTIVSVLLFLVGFLAELIVSQGERISLLERTLRSRPNRNDPP
jgi:hypothetical protein